MNNYVIYFMLCPLVTFWIMMQIMKSDGTKLYQIEVRNWFGILFLAVIWPITILFLFIVFFVEGMKRLDSNKVFLSLTKERGVPITHIIIGGADRRVMNQMSEDLEPMTVEEIIGNRQVIPDRLERVTEEINEPDQFPIVVWKNDRNDLTSD